MLPLYEATTRKLVEGLQKHRMEKVQFFVIKRKDLRYLYFIPTGSIASRREKSWGQLRPKMPTEYQKISEDFRKCFDSHGNYMVQLHKNLSYKSNLEGRYRQMIYLYVAPRHTNNFLDLAKEIRNIFAVKELDFGYRLYQSGFGNQENFFLVELSSADAESRVASLEEFKEVRNKLIDVILRIESIEGVLRPDLSFNGSDLD